VTTATDTHAPSRACYLRGCREPGCEDANFRYLKQYRISRHRTGHRRVASAPVSNHVRALAAQGWSERQIAAAAQCSTRIINSLLNGQYPTTNAQYAARILATEPTIAACPPRTYVDATGTIRRAQALIAIGHPLIWIANETGMSRGALGRVLNHGHERLTARHAVAIADLYDKWKDHPGANTRARLRAAADGWRTPDYWDDVDHIDDPTFDPAAKQLRIEQVGEDAAWLKQFGLTVEQIASRLGISRDYVEKGLRHIAATGTDVAA
jgi:AraC-like DNA-binding protein